MKELFEAVCATHTRLQGWCELDKAICLASIVAALRPAVSLEIGIYGGKSFVPIALAHKAINFGIAYGIEPWSREEAMKAQVTEADLKWWETQDLEAIYRYFLSQIDRLKLQEFVRIIRQPSRSVLPMRDIGLLHIDGAHSDESIKDVSSFAPNVMVGGFCVMDDLGWSGGGVTRAANSLGQLGFVERYKLGTGAVFQKIR